MELPTNSKILYDDNGAVWITADDVHARYSTYCANDADEPEIILRDPLNLFEDGNEDDSGEKGSPEENNDEEDEAYLDDDDDAYLEDDSDDDAYLEEDDSYLLDTLTHLFDNDDKGSSTLKAKEVKEPVAVVEEPVGVVKNPVVQGFSGSSKKPGSLQTAEDDSNSLDSDLGSWGDGGEEESSISNDAHTDDVIDVGNNDDFLAFCTPYAAPRPQESTSGRKMVRTGHSEQRVQDVPTPSVQQKTTEVGRELRPQRKKSSRYTSEFILGDPLEIIKQKRPTPSTSYTRMSPVDKTDPSISSLDHDYLKPPVSQSVQKPISTTATTKEQPTKSKSKSKNHKRKKLWWGKTKRKQKERNSENARAKINEPIPSGSGWVPELRYETYDLTTSSPDTSRMADESNSSDVSLFNRPLSNSTTDRQRGPQHQHHTSMAVDESNSSDVPLSNSTTGRQRRPQRQRHHTSRAVDESNSSDVPLLNGPLSNSTTGRKRRSQHQRHHSSHRFADQNKHVHHNQMERVRRGELRQLFQDLFSAIEPNRKVEKIPKIEILKLATQRVKGLKILEEKLAADLKELDLENKRLCTRLAQDLHQVAVEKNKNLVESYNKKKQETLNKRTYDYKNNVSLSERYLRQVTRFLDNPDLAPTSELNSNDSDVKGETD